MVIQLAKSPANKTSEGYGDGTGNTVEENSSIFCLI